MRPLDRAACESYADAYWGAGRPEANAYVHPFYLWSGRATFAAAHEEVAGQTVIRMTEGDRDLFRVLPGACSSALPILAAERRRVWYVPRELASLGHDWSESPDDAEFVYSTASLADGGVAEVRKRSVRRFFSEHPSARLTEAPPGADPGAHEAVFAAWLAARGAGREGSAYVASMEAQGAGLRTSAVGDFGSRLFELWVGGRLAAFALGMSLRSTTPTFCALVSYYDPEFGDGNTPMLVSLAAALRPDFQLLNFCSAYAPGLAAYKRSLRPAAMTPCGRLEPGCVAP